MRVVQVVSNPGVGGLEHVVTSLASGLAARGHEVHAALFCDARARRPPMGAALEHAGVVVRLQEMAPRAYAQERREVAALCRRVDADLVHTHGYRADVLDAPAARQVGTPTVTTVHGLAGGDLKNRVFEALQLRAFRRFDAVVAVSQRLADDLVARGVPSARVRTIVNAWYPGPPPLDREAARRALGLGVDGFRVGFVGRLSREKGADLLVEGVALLHEPRLAVSVVGEGRERGALEALASERGLGGCVSWHGVVADAARFMRAFDVLVMPSRTEGTPIALFEAMAASVPIVATAVGGVPAVVGESGALVVPPERPDALARAIAAVLRDPAEAQRRAAVALQRLREQYGAEPWLDAYEALYGVVAARRRR